MLVPNWVITVSADGLAPDGARPSAGTMAIITLGMPSFKLLSINNFIGFLFIEWRHLKWPTWCRDISLHFVKYMTHVQSRIRTTNEWTLNREIRWVDLTAFNNAVQIESLLFSKHWACIIMTKSQQVICDSTNQHSITFTLLLSQNSLSKYH